MEKCDSFAKFMQNNNKKFSIIFGRTLPFFFYFYYLTNLFQTTCSELYQSKMNCWSNMSDSRDYVIISVDSSKNPSPQNLIKG